MTDNFFTRVKGRARKLGWVQGSYARESGAGCLAGLMGVNNSAVLYAMTVEDRRKIDEARMFAMRHIGGEIEGWNDSEGRTLAEVLALLDDLAEAWESRSQGAEDPEPARACALSDYVTSTTYSEYVLTMVSQMKDYYTSTSTSTIELAIPAEWVEKELLVDA